MNGQLPSDLDQRHDCILFATALTSFVVLSLFLAGTKESPRWAGEAPT
jgi:hypothetical protein